MVKVNLTTTLLDCTPTDAAVTSMCANVCKAKLCTFNYFSGSPGVHCMDCPYDLRHVGIAHKKVTQWKDILN